MEGHSEQYFDKLIQLDCRKAQGHERIQEYLKSVPQIKKAFEKYVSEVYEDEEEGMQENVPMEMLERYLHQVSVRKGYQVINIQPFYGKGHKEFVFYTNSAKRTSDNVWIGNVYGVTLYEVVSKLIILINKDIKYPRNSEGEYKYE